MPIVRALSWLYALLYAVAGAVGLALGHLDAVVALWLPFGAAVLAFCAALASPTRLGRFAAAAVASAVTATCFVWAAWAPLALWDEDAALGTGDVLIELLLLSSVALALTGLGAGTHLLYRELGGPRRRRGLLAALAVPSAAALVSALSGLVCLLLTPRGFLYGLVALLALSWAALAAAFLAAGWLAFFVIRAAPPPPEPPPLPTARVRAG